MMMFLMVTGTTMALFAVIAYIKLKSMRPVDRMRLLLSIVVKLKFFQLIKMLGLDSRMRPNLIHSKVSNGFKYLLPPTFAPAIEEILTFKVREDDVYVVTYPKAGTTWMQEITWLICNDCDIDGAKKQSITMRFPMIEAVDSPMIKGIHTLEAWPENKQRLIKTHLPYELLPADIRYGKKCKILYAARNPKDLCVSFYHFHRMLPTAPNPGTWEQFLTKFCTGNVAYGSWFDHTLKFWEKYQEDKDRIYFVTYEDLKKDLRKEVESISKFLEKKLSERQLDVISEHCTFDSMSKNRSTNMSGKNNITTKKFMRKGQVGDWKNHFTINQSSAFDEMYEEKMKGTGLNIPFHRIIYCKSIFRRKMMLELGVSVTASALFAAIAYFKLKSMRKVDKLKLLLAILGKLKIPQMLRLTGLDVRMRPKLTECTASNEFKLLLPPMFTATVEEVLKFKVREDDVYVITYPKAGTTWMQEIAWLLCNNGNIDEAKKQSVAMRSPMLETVDFTISNGIQSLETWPKDKQRVIKTHFPYELLPEDIKQGKKCKIIYVARNPKDLCVSYYHFHRMITGMPDPGTWEEFLAKFCSDKLGYGSYFDHTLKFWEKYQDDKQRIYFVTYEDLKKDLRKEVESIAKFLEKKLSDKQMDAISEHCTFGSMSKNKSTNMSAAAKYGMDLTKSKFMRKGEVGDWKNHFTINQSSAFDTMYQDKIKETGFDIQFEI
ncbi:uncharacterized protein LOC120326527 [Styela clava]